MTRSNVLIFPAGGENAINIHDSLKYNLHFELYGASSRKDYGASLYPKKNYCISNLYINNDDFIDKFNGILHKFQIDYIVPTHDTIALFLMEHESEIDAKIVCSPLATTKLANSKIDMFQVLEKKEYCPTIFHDIDSIAEYPVFVKPDVGAGGKGTFVAQNKEALVTFLKDKKDMLISEFLPGEELTIDCFTNYKGEILFIGPRTRERITMGISFCSQTIELTEEIEKIAYDLNSTFQFRGAWFFQVKKDKNGIYKIMEFSVRQAGTMALYRMLGINFALLSLFDAMQIDVKLMFNHYNLSLERRLQNSYQLDYIYDTVYIDFDDTIIVNGIVNTDAMKFLYQCSNKNIKVYLLTKHSNDIYEDLKKYHIPSTLFQQIYLLKTEEHKSDYVKKENSIFIDNYYLERKEVFEHCNIPVFDVDAIACLINYSEL